MCRSPTPRHRTRGLVPAPAARIPRAHATTLLTAVPASSNRHACYDAARAAFKAQGDGILCDVFYGIDGDSRSGGAGMPHLQPPA